MAWRSSPTIPHPNQVHRDYIVHIEATGGECLLEHYSITRIMKAHGFEDELPSIYGRTLAPFRNMFMLKRSLLSMDTVRSLVAQMFDSTPYKVRWFIAEVSNVHWSPE